MDDYRDSAVTRTLISRIRAAATRPWAMMEVYGGQTRTIVEGLSQLVTPAIEVTQGPVCPTCVVPATLLDKAARLAAMPNVVVTSLGGPLRPPGRECELHAAPALGGRARIVHSPLDALAIAIEEPDREVVFFAIGFETMAPANAMVVWRARELGVRNFSVLVAHVTVPPTMISILEDPGNRVHAFLAAGHVGGAMGWMDYEPIAVKYRVPIVVTGFEPVDVLEGMLLALQQLEAGRYEVENQYARSVRRDGTPLGRDLVAQVFQVVDREWHGIGTVPGSGLALRSAYADYDAELRFGLADPPAPPPPIG